MATFLRRQTVAAVAATAASDKKINIFITSDVRELTTPPKNLINVSI